MRVLVIGGNGFIGSEVTRNLQSAGINVKTMSRNISSSIDVEQFIGDLHDPESYVGILQTWKPQVVIQSAWVTDQDAYRASEENDAYKSGTIHFAENCFKYNVEHFIGLGSCAEYGQTQLNCIAGSTPTQPMDNYSRAKVEASNALVSLASEYSSRLTWARIFQPYGRHQDSKRLVPKALSVIRNSQTIHLKYPNSILDWISTRDIASAIEYCISKPTEEVVDIGTTIGTSVLDLMYSQCKVVGADENLVTYERNTNEVGEIELVAGKDSPLLKRGWSPADNLISGLSWTIDK